MKNLKLKAARAGMDLSQEELAAKCGVSRQTISAIENGVNKPAIETIVLISDALNCTVSDLVGQTAPVRDEMDPYTQRLTSIFYQLNDAGKDFLLSQADFAIRQVAFRQDGSMSSAI